MVVHLLVVRDHDAVVLVLQRCVVSLRPPKSRLHFDPPMATVFIRRPAVTESERENQQVEVFPLFAMAWAIPGQISNVHLNLWSCAIKISREIQMEGFADTAVNVAWSCGSFSFWGVFSSCMPISLLPPPRVQVSSWCTQYIPGACKSCGDTYLCL